MTVDKGQGQEEKFKQKLKNDRNEGAEGKPELKTDSGEKKSFLSSLMSVLGFGFAVLAIILALLVMKKVDNNIGRLSSGLKNLEIKTTTFKTEVNEKLGYVDFEIGDIKAKVEKSQRMAAIIELKRALVTVGEVSLVEESPEIQAKSKQLVSNIELFLQDLSAVKKNTPAGTIEVMEEPGEGPSRR